MCCLVRFWNCVPCCVRNPIKLELCCWTHKQLLRLLDRDSIVAAEKQHACCVLRVTHFANVKFIVSLQGLSALLFLFSYLRSKTSGEPEEGYKVKVFSSLELASCWEPAACKRRFGERLGVGHIFNSVKKQLVWIYFHSCLELPSSQTHEGEDLSRGASSMKNLPSITVVLYACCFCGIVEFADCQRGASFYVVNWSETFQSHCMANPLQITFFKLKL